LKSLQFAGNFKTAGNFKLTQATFHQISINHVIITKIRRK